MFKIVLINVFLLKKYATYFKLSKILDKILKFYWNKYISYIFQKKYFFSEKIKFEFHYILILKILCNRTNKFRMDKELKSFIHLSKTPNILKYDIFDI